MKNFLKIVKSFVVLDASINFSVSTVVAHDVSHLLNVFSFTNKTNGDHVDTLLDESLNVSIILLSDSSKFDDGAGQVHGFTLSNNGVILNLCFDGVLKNFSYFASNAAVINQNHRSNGHGVWQLLVISRKSHIITFHSLISYNFQGLAG